MKIYVTTYNYGLLRCREELCQELKERFRKIKLAYMLISYFSVG